MQFPVALQNFQMPQNAPATKRPHSILGVPWGDEELRAAGAQWGVWDWAPGELQDGDCYAAQVSKNPNNDYHTL